LLSGEYEGGTIEVVEVEVVATRTGGDTFRFTLKEWEEAARRMGRAKRRHVGRAVRFSLVILSQEEFDEVEAEREAAAAKARAGVQ